jgi:hypothetical protein
LNVVICVFSRTDFFIYRCFASLGLEDTGLADITSLLAAELTSSAVKEQSSAYRHKVARSNSNPEITEKTVGKCGTNHSYPVPSFQVGGGYRPMPSVGENIEKRKRRR